MSTPPKFTAPQEIAIDSLSDSKVKKNVSNCITVPMQYFTGDAYKLVGNYIFNEKIIQPVSALGYYGSSAIKGVGSVLETAVDILFHEDVAGTAADLGQTAVEAKFEEAGAMQSAVSQALQVGVGQIPVVGPSLALGAKRVEDLGQANLQLGVKHVRVARSIFDWASKIFLKPIASTTKLLIHYCIKKPAEYFADMWQKLSKNPSQLREYLIEAGDQMIGSAWRSEMAAQNFFNQVSAYADQKNTQASDKIVHALSPQQFQALSPAEKLKLIKLIQKFNLTLSDRNRLHGFEMDIEINKALSEEGVLFILERFNTLPFDQQAELLNIGSKEVASLTREEQFALVGMLIDKVMTNRTGKNEHDIQDLEFIREQLKGENSILSTGESKKISHCFKKYFSYAEKSVYRQLLNEKVSTVQISDENLDSAIKKLEDEIQKRSERLTSASGSEEILNTLDLVEALKYLHNVRRTRLTESEIQSGVELLSANKVSFGLNDLTNAVGDQIKSQGAVTSLFDTLGVGIEQAVQIPIRGLSKLMEGLGILVHPKLIEANINLAATWIEYSDAFSSLAKLSPLLFGTVAANANWAGFTKVGSLFSSLQTGAAAISDKASAISDYTIHGIVAAERNLIGASSALIRFEQAAWQQYIIPVLQKMKTISGLQQQAAELEILVPKLMQLDATLAKQTETISQTFLKDFKGVAEQLKNYNLLVSQLKEQGLQEGTKEFYKQLLVSLGNEANAAFGGLVQKAPLDCGWFGFFCGPADPLGKMSPLISKAQDIRNNIDALSKKQEVAQAARVSLDTIQQTWDGFFTAQTALSPQAVDAITLLHNSVSSSISTTIQGADLVQKGLQVQLETANCQANLFTTNLYQGGTGLVQGGVESLQVEGNGSPLTMGAAYIGRSALELAQVGVNYLSGRLAAKVMTRFAGRALRRASPHVAKHLQPFWCSCARAVSLTGAGLGSLAGGGVQLVGKGLQAITDTAFTAGYELLTGERYIDLARISKFKNLSEVERQHLIYTVLHDPDCIGIRKKLANDLEISIDSGAASNTIQWYADNESMERELKKAQTDQVISHLLQGFDITQAEKKMVISPYSLLSMEKKEQERVVRLVSDKIGLTVEEIKNPRLIAQKFNELEREKRVKVSMLSVAEFIRLDIGEQHDILYDVIFSDTYRREKYGSFNDEEARLKLCDDYKKIDLQGSTKKELKTLLEISSRLKPREKGNLTPHKLLSMPLSDQRIQKLYDLVADRGKLRHYKQMQKEDLALLVDIFNKDLEPFQQALFSNLTLQEYEALDQYERNGLHELLDIELDAVVNRDVILQAFNKLSVEKRCEWHQNLDTGRLAKQIVIDEVKKEIEHQTATLQALSRELDQLGKQQNLAKVNHDVKQSELKAKIKEIEQVNIPQLIKQLKNLEQKNEQKSLLVATQPSVEPKLQSVIETNFKSRIFEEGPDRAIEQMASLVVDQVKTNPEIARAYYKHCQTQLEKLHAVTGTARIAVVKQVKLLEKAMPSLVSSKATKMLPSQSQKPKHVFLRFFFAIGRGLKALFQLFTPQFWRRQ